MNEVLALELERVGKQFGNVTALVDASLAVRPGTVHALLGENGAGKTTLMRVAFGMLTPDSGTVRVHGKSLRLHSPSDAIAHGIAMVHQHFTLVPAMTVAENIALGGHGRFDSDATALEIRELARATGLSVDPDARVRDLPIAAQQRLELLKALSRDARIIILDEPTAVLAPEEATDLLRRVRELADGGRAIVLITHKLGEALSVADDITVLRRGATVLSKPRQGLQQRELVDAMLGQGEVRPPRVPDVAASAGIPHPVIISARDVSISGERRAPGIVGATFDVRGGEIVGIAAVEGSGHRELLRAAARRLPISSGSLELPHAVGFIPDDRHRDGLVLDMTVVENFAIRGAGTRRGVIEWASMTAAAERVVAEFDVRVGGVGASARTMSGGNQQKFIVGRELEGSPRALIVDNPTRGLDIRATAFVQTRLLQARAEGVAIMLHSADLDEVLDLADRVLVVFNGRVREVPKLRDAIGRAMVGATE